MDKAAVGFDYKSQAEKHDSQKGELGAPCSGRARTAARTVPLGCGTLCCGFAACCGGAGGAAGCPLLAAGDGAGGKAMAAGRSSG